MIKIYVKGQPVSLYRNTSITVELNNALFASPDIEGDISFSFTLPVEGNERVLEFAHLPQTGKLKKLPCHVYCNGGFNWDGQLVLQKSGRENITAALVINPYPEGFGKAKLTEDNDDEITISQSQESHNQAWEDFLIASTDNQDVKFAPFINEEGYGSDNEDYGLWNGISRRKIVNALFFDPDGSLINAAGRIFSKAHNERLTVETADGTDEEGNPILSNHVETNQLAFCPQIRITRIMEMWCRNAGYNFINHLGEDLDYTYLQSQKSLDATKSQFGMVDGLTIRTTASQWVSGGYHYCNSYWIDGHSQDDYVHNGRVWLPLNGWWDVEIYGNYDTVLSKHLPHFKHNEFAVMQQQLQLIIFKGQLTMDLTTGSTGGTDVLHIENIILNETKDFSLQLRKYIPAEYANEGLGFALMCKAKYYGYESLGQGYYSEHAEEIVTTWQEVENMNMEIMFHSVAYDRQQSGFNVFRNKFKVPELLPDVTNASWMKTMMETMGLCYFISAKTKTIEIVPYAHLKQSKSLDLTEYEMTRETTTESRESTMRTFRLKPMKDEDYNEDLRLEDVDMTLPDAYMHHEKLVMRKRTNTLYRAEKKETAGENWMEGWEEFSGNPDRLEVGEGDEENREPSVLVPHQRLFSMGRRHPDTDTQSGQTPQLMVADFTICSDIYNTTEKPNEIILTQYRGLLQRSWEAATDHPNPCNEVMLPVWNDGFSLTAKGRNSLGEKYVKPVLELLGNKTVTYKFRLPYSMMQAVEDTLRPTELQPEKQTRYIIVRNVKSVPKKITYQINNDSDDTVLCQIEAVKVY